MKRFSLSLLALFLLLTQSKAQVTQQDSLALISINNTTLGVGWTQKWIRTNPVGTWLGVTIANGRVTGINLQGNNLAGSLNSANIAKLTKLKVLNFSHNSIGGSIPAGIGSLTELEQLNLSFNAFTGTTPSGLFNNLQQLTHVNFANNNISGWFPSSVSNATALAEINFSNNAMTNKIPATVNNLTLLTKFLVNNNKLIGPFPTGKLCSATVQVDVSSNQFNFTGLECLGANPNAVYNNQQQLTLAQNNLALSVTAGGTLANNTYTWYRNGGSTPYFVSNGTTNKLNTTTNGKYWAVVTNSAAPALTLRTDTVLLNGSIKSDSLALVDLYNSTNGSAWINKTNWITSAPVSQWFGVGMNEGRVESLWLNDNNLDGQLPASFENLPFAYELVLKGNKLKGEIPRTFASHDVFHIDLSSNQFTSIPSDYNIISTFLDLSNNQLSGLVPVPVITVPILRLQGNRFNFSDLVNANRQDGGIILDPQQPKPLIVNAPTLKIAVGGNPANNVYRWYRDGALVASTQGDSTFTMTVPGNYNAIVYNTTINNLLLTSETFFYTAPGFTQDSLALVDFYNNITSGLNWVLTDPVSTWEGLTIENGRVVELYADNSLTGTLSPSLGNLSELKSIWIGYDLTGTVPTTICNLTKLQYLAINGNFTGTLPDDLGKYQQSLFHLEIGGGLAGNIPSGLQYASQLSELYIGGNQFSGSIPSFLKNLPISDLNLSNNHFTGSIPDTLSKAAGISNIDLRNNQLTGTIPKWLKHRAIYINLSYNKLSGSLPDSIADYAPWVILNNNRFTGQLPSFDGLDLELDVSNNLLQSVSPSNCNVDFSYPGKVNVSNNQLNFTALQCLNSVTGLEELITTPQQRIPIINTNPVLKAAAGGTLANNTYRWLRNTGTFVTKVGDSTLTITTPGVYACIVTNSAVPGVELRTHNANISTVSSRKMQPASPDDLAGAIPGKLSVYPNPTGNDFIYIKGLQKAESILLYNASGQLVKQWQNVNGNQQLNIGSITNGVYMVKVVEKDKQTMLKFIKQ